MMNVGISASTTTSTSTSLNSLLTKNPTFKPKFSSPLIANYPHNHAHIHLSSSRTLSRRPISCNSSPGPGESDNRTVLDAFFLGKALGEALTERVESVVGELLSTVGRLQAEQQKQIQDFQEDVLERAKQAKDKAAREALEAQGRLIPNSTKGSASVTNGASSGAEPQPDGSVTAVVIPNGPAYSVDENRPDQDSLSSIPIDGDV